MKKTSEISDPTHESAPEAGRFSGPSTREMLRRDGRPISAFMELESPRFLGDEDIPFERYTSQEFFDLEMEKMWPRVWQWACREEHIPEAGDYYVYSVGRYSILVVRDDDNSIKGYVNSCLHRGTKFRRDGDEGSMAEIRCPFHGWTWSLGGELKKLPCAWDAPHVAQRNFSLPQVKVATWGGFVFINMDLNAEPLEEYLHPVPDHVEKFHMEDRYIAIHIEKELYCNWKSAVEAFIECYHVQETHPQQLDKNYDEAAQFDVFSDNVSRFITLFGIPSPHLGLSFDEQEKIDKISAGNSILMSDVKLQEGETARTAIAAILRQKMSEVYQVDLSKFTDTDIIDNSNYSVFPNFIFKPQLLIPLAYRIRPMGNDPNRSLLELFIMPPVPENGARPYPAVPVRLAETESFTSVPGFDRALAETFDQDTGNMRAQQEGFAAARKNGATLLNYNEVRVRLQHQTLDSYIRAD